MGAPYETVDQQGNISLASERWIAGECEVKPSEQISLSMSLPKAAGPHLISLEIIGSAKLSRFAVTAFHEVQV